MNMKWWLFSLGVIGVLLLFPVKRGEAVPVCTEETPPRNSAAQLARIEKYESRVKHYKKGWEKLIPEYFKLQFAGSIGMFSTGLGWDYGRKEQWETDLLLGIIPRFSSNQAKATFTIKQNYIPWKIPVYRRWSVEPLTTGIFVNSVLAKDFWGKEPDRYPNNYYKFSTRIRFHVFLGQRFTFVLDRDIPSRTVTFFYEFNTCDLYLISAATNKYLKPSDILCLSFGLKFKIL